MKVTVVRRVGKCRRCGKCCRWSKGCVIPTTIWERQRIAPEHDDRSFVVNSLRDIVPVMRSLGFNVLSIEEVHRGEKHWKSWAIRIRCLNITNEGCAIHERKPHFCSAYPVSPDAKKFKGCGFSWKRTTRKA